MNLLWKQKYFILRIPSNTWSFLWFSGPRPSWPISFLGTFSWLRILALPCRRQREAIPRSLWGSQGEDLPYPLSPRAARQGPKQRHGFLTCPSENSFPVIKSVPRGLSNCPRKLNKCRHMHIQILYYLCGPLYGSSLAWWLLKMSHLMLAMFPDPSQTFSHHVSSLAGARVGPGVQQVCLGSS